MEADSYVFSVRESGSDTEETFEISTSTTLGRHLDNDVIVAGEDVLDYHLRIEPYDRGIKLYPLGDATFEFGGVERSQAIGLVPGEEFVLGRTHVRLESASSISRNIRWYLVSEEDGSEIRVPEQDDYRSLTVGRGPDNLLRLEDDHISRLHAELLNRDGDVWLRDSASANGTFVNAERVQGGCRLFHGDEIGFDAFKYQLIGRGADLTPVRVHGHTGEQIVVPGEISDRNDTTEIAAITTVTDDHLLDLGRSGSPSTAGCYLLGISDPYQGDVFPTPLGRFVVGRDAKCDIVLSEPTVSSRHAELAIRAENCSVTNLMSTNGTRVNGQEVESAYLKDGDVIRLGQVRFVFRAVVNPDSQEHLMRRLQVGLLAGSAVLALALALLLIL